jgi:hypothetical protein
LGLADALCHPKRESLSHRLGNPLISEASLQQRPGGLFTSKPPIEHETSLSAPGISEPVHLAVQGEQVQAAENESSFSGRLEPSW